MLRRRIVTWEEQDVHTRRRRIYTRYQRAGVAREVKTCTNQRVSTSGRTGTSTLTTRMRSKSWVRTTMTRMLGKGFYIEHRIKLPNGSCVWGLRIPERKAKVSWGAEGTGTVQLVTYAARRDSQDDPTER